MICVNCQYNNHPNKKHRMYLESDDDEPFIIPCKCDCSF